MEQKKFKEYRFEGAPVEYNLYARTYIPISVSSLLPCKFPISLSFPFLPFCRPTTQSVGCTQFVFIRERVERLSQVFKKTAAAP